VDTNTIGVPTRVNIGGMPMAITGSVIGALAAFYIVRKIKAKAQACPPRRTPTPPRGAGGGAGGGQPTQLSLTSLGERL